MNAEEGDKTREQSKSEEERPHFVIRLPGFIKDDAVGLGDIIKRATASVGIPSCGSCQRRAEFLNRYVSVAGRRRR